jgi:uncharacterized damage-inducible protein DinB
MRTESIASTITRELRALIREIQSFPDDEALWQSPPGVTNPAGTLALHLCGNLQHYIGAKLGASDYKRDRPAEFSRRDVSRDELIREAEKALEAVERVLPRVSDETLAADFSEAVGGQILRTDDFLLHLATHLAYHLGQIDYHRRLVTGDTRTVGAVAAKELTSARPAS